MFQKALKTEGKLKFTLKSARKRMKRQKWFQKVSKIRQLIRQNLRINLLEMVKLPLKSTENSEEDETEPKME